MALFLGRDKKFSDLTPDELRMATEYLPYDDKIKLVDIFPPVIKQIKIFDMNRHNPPKGDNFGEDTDEDDCDWEPSCDQFDWYGIENLENLSDYRRAKKHFNAVVELFEKLTSVREIIMPYCFESCLQVPYFHILVTAIANSKNMKIEWFYRMNYPVEQLPCHCICQNYHLHKCGDLDFYEEDIDMIIRYIENARECDSSYDASCIKNKFNIYGYRFKKVYNLFKKYPDLKLKLDLRCYQSDKSSVSDLFRNKIVSYRPVRPLDMVLESVTHIDLTGVANEDQLKKVVKFTPNVTWLKYVLHMTNNFDPQSVVDCILSIPKLDSLELYFSHELGWSQGKRNRFNAMVQLVLASRHRPLLTSITIESDWGKWQLADTLAMDIKEGLKFFSLLKVLTDDEDPHDRITVKNKTMEMDIYTKHQMFQPSLALTFSKFSYVNYIHIRFNCRDYGHRVQEEIETIKANLPRNRCVHYRLQHMEFKPGEQDEVDSYQTDTGADDSEAGEDDN